MFKSYIEECRPNMFQLQCLKKLEQQEEENREYNEAEIARNLGVNRSTVSRYLKRCVDYGILSEEKRRFTKKGKEILSYYKVIEADLYLYFEKIGINGEEQEAAVSGMLDGLDIQTIQTICQKEKMHLQYENLGKSGGKEISSIPPDILDTYLQRGIYEVDFSLYRQGKDSQKLSMADKGFQKPARLYFEPEREYVELTVQELKAYSGKVKSLLLHGHVHTIKCRCHDDGLKPLEIKEGKVQIPLKEFWFESPAEGTLIGQVQLMMTSNIGKMHMPESVATLIIRM